MKLGNRLTHSILLAILLLAFLLCLTACQESTGSKYERANKLLTEGKYTEAAAIFDEISTYEDASKMSLYTKAINAAETGDYDTAFTTFASLGEFKDCSMMITYYMGRQNEASVYDGARIYGNKWFDAIELYESIPLFRDSKDRAENCRKAAYDQAIKSGDEGDTSFAISILKELGTYSDAAKQVTYYQAVALLKKGDYSGTSRAFGSIPGFRDADDRVTSVLEDGYKVAAAKEEAGELDKAHAIYLNLGNYKDSAERAYKLYYDAGITRREAGDWNGAISAFTKAGKYSDAPEQIKETTYQEASALEAAGDQESAYQLFISLGEYKDSFERANKPFYELGVAKRDAQEWDASRAAFKHAGTYSDAEEQILVTYYMEGEAKRIASHWNGARKAFKYAGDYLDSASQINETTYQEASALEAAGDQEGAYKLFISLGEYKDSFERANKPFYDLGVAKRDAQEWDASRDAFKHAGTYSDAEEQIKETTYQEAASAYEVGGFEKAYSLYYSIKGYKDVDRLLKEDNNIVAIREAKIAPFRGKGKVVTFGTYPQTKEGTDQTPIEWIVLDYDETNHKALLISKYGLDAVPYNNKKYTDITWEQCTLRTWLNGEFLNKAFSTKEQSAILITDVDNSSSQGYSEWNTKGGSNTQDQVFLLSYAEANRYLGVTDNDSNNNSISSVARTAYAIAQGAISTYSNQAGMWWLRSPGFRQSCAALVYYDGTLTSSNATHNYCVVRPAFWLNLESDF